MQPPSSGLGICLPFLGPRTAGLLSDRVNWALMRLQPLIAPPACELHYIQPAKKTHAVIEFLEAWASQF